MLREELLRSKQDEIARCLLSRKRKLSELYFATVGYAGATENPFADSVYQEKEQAFLDANDITKGRYFNEATLPALPTYATIPTQETKEIQLDTSAQGSTAVDAIPSTPSPHEKSPSSVASQPTAGVERSKVRKSQPVEKKPSRPVPKRLDIKPIIQPSPDTHNGSQGPDAPTPNAVSILQRTQEGTSSVLETPRSSQDSTEANVSINQANSPKALSPTQTFVSLQANHGLHPSLRHGRSAQVAERSLSPSSSAVPYSNNTPAPTAASPATGPLEEVTELVEKPSSPKQPIAAAQGPSSFVPSTPDEQLRFEEAQSLQQNALLASQFKDGAALGPSANQVIREDLPSTSAAAEPQKGALGSKSEDIRPEPKKLDTASDAVLESKPPAQEQSASQPEQITKEAALAPQTVKKSSPHSHTGPILERMTTRVSSGAIRHKSVSEILGEAPKLAAPYPDKVPSAEKPPDAGRTTAGVSVDSAARIRLKDRKAREKERSKLSTVVFPKQQPLQQHDKGVSLDLVRQPHGDLARLNEEQDYLFTLFQNKAYAPPRGTPLNALLSSAHKTLSTKNYLLDYQEQMDVRILRRIYDLQNANRWPLRQLKRSPEPPRQGSHWDVLLDHMKWMRTDYREERKWKLAAAKSCADWCAEYVQSDPDSRSLLRVQARIPPRKVHEKTALDPSTMTSPDEPMHDALETSHPTPELVPSTEEDSLSEGFVDELRHDLQDTVAPAAIFSLGSDEFTFSLDMTPSAQKLLDELPIYAPIQISPNMDFPSFKAPPDSSWKTDILPVSKYACGKIKFLEDEPPRKRSRYDYSQYNSGSEHPVLDLPPEQTNVALFQPENRHMRDRIHPSQPFRPPTEYPMPSLGFLESRQSSQWTYAEDEELRSLVEEYSYNWSLISSCLTPPSLFASGAERRTPWECFERWAGIEGLPSDMSKTPYFRAYHQRIDTAQRNVMAQQQAAAQQQQQQQGNNNNNQQPVSLIRRRGTQPIRVDRRRSSRHLALLDAMRKLAKKRETMIQKQQQASHLASLRKVNEANQPKPPISSPAEFSRLKHEREMKLQERQEQYRQQMIAQQRASLAARAGQMPNQQQMMTPQGRTPNAMPQNTNAAPVAANAPNGLPNGMPNGLPNGVPNGIPNGVPQGVGVNQTRPQLQGIQGGGGPINGQMPPNAMPMKMMPQPGMQQNNGPRSNMSMQASPDNARVIREANRLQEQQRLLQSRQQQQHHQLQQPQPQPASQPQGQQQQLPQQPQAQQPQQQFHAQPQFVPQGSNSPNMNMPTVNGNPNNPAVMAALQAGGGMQSPQFHNTTPQGVSTPSPRMGQPNLLSSGVVPTISSIQSQIQRNNPNMPIEQVNKLATDRLHQYQQQRMSQVAMNAAAGNLGVQPNYQVPHDGNFQTPQSGMNGGPGMQVPQSQGFSPMMRVQQPAQQNRTGTGSSPAMGVAMPQQSRSATPQTQRSGSVQTGPVPGASKSPNHPQAQSMGA
ncbi:MYB and HSA domain protein [Aspergillus lucknowensis]|uniref:Vacuolar import and degradation protein 21 n=1 Tax=Aspergillus lucknowensis TaxID=176173 RepID=A0ABR4LTV6_9EURO